MRVKKYLYVLSFLAAVFGGSIYSFAGVEVPGEAECSATLECPGGGRISCTGLICAVGKDVISCIDAQGNRSMSFCLTDAN